MKIKEKETKKNLSPDELSAELIKLREKKFRLEFKHKVTPLSNPLELRAVRRNIARIETWLRQKELEGGKE